MGAVSDLFDITPQVLHLLSKHTTTAKDETVLKERQREQEVKL